MKKLIHSFLFVLCPVSALQTESTAVATYNLRSVNAGDSTDGNGWGQRYPYIVQLIQFYGFDTFGIQEGRCHQLQDLKNAMPGYDCIGVGRNDGKQASECSAVFYRTGKLEVLDHGDFWLSTITDRSSKGWDIALPRIYTWGKFRDKQTGFTFLPFNLHMDHTGVQTRAEGIKFILKKLKELPEKLPAIPTGGFNVGQHNESYLLLDSSGIMQDSYQVVGSQCAPNGTLNALHADRKMDSRVGHLSLTKEFDVKKYGVSTDTCHSEAKDMKNEQNASSPKEAFMQKHIVRVPSGHFPVMIVIEIR